MKTLITLLFLTSFKTLARPKHEIINCLDESGYGAMSAFLDSGGFRTGSGRTEAVSAKIHYHYSNTQGMTCVGGGKYGDYDIDCVGYYYSREVTELKIRTIDGDVKAFWQTSQPYGNVNKTTLCTVQ